MKELNINGVSVQLDDDGYLTDSSQWNEDIAKALAKEDGIELTDKHIEVLKYLRDVFNKGEALTIRKVGKSGIVNIKEFYKLFPKGPLKLSSKFAGLPKPTSCV
ncbi:MAG TPA: TusE/DsrC/DsvC family sulfur relay protein [Bacteroidetes bacterium]|nr:TusE/DsrC/DsvC family sulfur relay protein [Bacteroidota bacterium]